MKRNLAGIGEWYDCRTSGDSRHRLRKLVLFQQETRRTKDVIMRKMAGFSRGGASRKDDREEVNIHCMGLAEELEEDFHPFGSGSYGDDGSVHSLKRAVGDFYLVACLDDG